MVFSSFSPYSSVKSSSATSARRRRLGGRNDDCDAGDGAEGGQDSLDGPLRRRWQPESREETPKCTSLSGTRSEEESSPWRAAAGSNGPERESDRKRRLDDTNPNRGTSGHHDIYTPLGSPYPNPTRARSGKRILIGLPLKENPLYH